MNDYDRLRQELVEARIAAGLSQQDVANILGTSQAAVNRYENGSRQPCGTRLTDLAAAVGHRLVLEPLNAASDIDTAALDRADGWIDAMRDVAPLVNQLNDALRNLLAAGPRKD